MELENLIDWESVMSQPRCAGGHEEVMRAIFGGNSKVAAWWSENDYQGTIAIAHELNDGRIAIMTDYYGSCSGCDAWEDSTEEQARKMVHDLVQGAKVFAGRKEAAEWCRNVDSEREPWNYPFESARHLADTLAA